MDCIFYISGSGTIIVTTSNLASQSPNRDAFHLHRYLSSLSMSIRECCSFQESFFFFFFGQRPVISTHTWSTTPSRRISGDEATGVSRARYMTVIAAPDGRFFRRVPREMSFPPSFSDPPSIRVPSLGFTAPRLFWMFREIPSCRLRNRRSKLIQSLVDWLTQTMKLKKFLRENFLNFNKKYFYIITRFDCVFFFREKERERIITSMLHNILLMDSYIVNNSR